MANRGRIEEILERYHPEAAGGSSGSMASLVHKSGIMGLKEFCGTSGAELLEFALVLPFLVVIVIGIIDFGEAYNLQQKLTNAAREAARITASNPVTNSSCNGNPCGIYAAADAVKQYLTNASASTASCITPNSPSSSGTSTWTYSCNSITLTINRSIVLTGAGGNVIPSTQVTLSYPYTWSFSHVIGLLVPGGTVSLPSTLTSTVVMANLI